MKQFIHSRSWLRKTVGVLLIVFGLFALIMPLVPGAVLALVGLEFIGVRLAFFDRFFPSRALVEPEVTTLNLSQEG